MEKLELKHICPYIPYGIEIITDWTDIKGVKCSNSIYNVTQNGIDKHLLYALESGACKILGLKSLNDLDYSILNKKYQCYKNNQLQAHNIFGISARDFYLLIENHYDVYGLIEKGLAIDINTIK